VWVSGVKYTKTTALTTTLGVSSGLYYIYFDATGTLGNQTTFFVWDAQAPTAYIYYNAANPTESMVFDERHGVTMDWATPEYLHEREGRHMRTGLQSMDTPQRERETLTRMPSFRLERARSLTKT
jgi:hypothetical protein